MHVSGNINPSSIDVILTNRKRTFLNSSVIETGLSDHHKMVSTFLKTDFKKKNRKEVHYRSYKNFDINAFRLELFRNLNNYNINNEYEDFLQIYMSVLNKHAPTKKKYVRGNQAPFMNKTLAKAFMHRSKLKNKFNKNPSNTNKMLYNKQRNYCVQLVKTEKKKYYNDLDTKIFADNKIFWKRIKPLFSDKKNHLQMTLC